MTIVNSQFKQNGVDILDQLVLTQFASKFLDGPALMCKNIKNVSVTDSRFENNKGRKGGAISLLDVLENIVIE